ncbi:MAG: hypothetical protein JNL01_08825 [Bdellovibrionales bacterium]|nr:hypothetical protein [Bdellovibrionales bacterium]
MKKLRSTALFPTLIFSTRFKDKKLCRELAEECEGFARLDDQGRKWSLVNYPHGYTSYASITDLHLRSSQFEKLGRWIDSQVAIFAQELGYDLKGGRLRMTTFWINIMKPGASHPFHLHPLSTVSGTFYLKTPPGCPAIRFEDPRATQFMARPSILEKGSGLFHTYKPSEGSLVLFESFVRHEVPSYRAGKSTKPRISVSFNYEWVQPDRF